MKTVCYLVMLSGVVLISAPTPGNAATNAQFFLKAEAERYVQAYMRQDHATCLNMMGGALVNALGGKITVLDHYRRTAEVLQQHRLTLEAITVDEPRAVVARGPKDQFVVIPEKIIFKGKEGQYLLNSYLLAVSENNGQSWNLLEGSWRVSEYIKNADLTLYDMLKLPVRKITLADDPHMVMLEKGGGFETSPETLKYRKTLRKNGP